MIHLRGGLGGQPSFADSVIRDNAKMASPIRSPLKDVQDSLHNIRYYLGLVSRPAACGRYSYKEKFIYWLILLGGVQQIVTGFILWFPVATTKYFPGQFIPASKAVHTNQAMLIFLLMAIWHIYDSMFSPDVFPLNKSIFTGYADKSSLEQDDHLRSQA